MTPRKHVRHTKASLNSWKIALISLATSDAVIQSAHGFIAPRSAFTLRKPNNFKDYSGIRIQFGRCSTCDQENLVGASEILNTHYDGEKVLTQPLKKKKQNVSSGIHIPQVKDVQVSLLSTDKKKEIVHNSPPIVITPRGDKSLKFLQSFMENNRDWIDRQMLHYGAVLLRGFEVKDAADVQSAIQSYQPNLNNEYRGTSPRSTQPGSEYIFSAAEVPSHYPIAQHLEMSFLQAPPKQLFFSALQAPKTIGGETALADFRRVYKDIPETLRKKLADKKIKYRRTQHKVGVKGFTRDVASMKGWPEIYGTEDKAKVERMALQEGTPISWEGPTADTLVSETVSEPFQLHPFTREPVWFNHVQVFHWTTFPAELFFAFRRTRQWRMLMHALIVSVYSLIKYGLLGHKMALDASFGDGTPFSMKEMSQIRHAIHKNMIFSRWRKGDVLMIDNFSTSHGRQPTYDKGRKVVVAWSDPETKANEYNMLPQEEASRFSAWE